MSTVTIKLVGKGKRPIVVELPDEHPGTEAIIASLNRLAGHSIASVAVEMPREALEKLWRDDVAAGTTYYGFDEWVKSNG